MVTSDETPKKSLWEMARSTAPAAPPPPPKLGLASYFDRQHVHGLWYNGQTVTLDGYTFSNCRFDNCLLLVHTPHFDLLHCVIDSTTQIRYSNALAKVLTLFASRYSWADAWFPNFLPVRHEDGTISITDLA